MYGNMQISAMDKGGRFRGARGVGGMQDQMGGTGESEQEAGEADRSIPFYKTADGGAVGAAGSAGGRCAADPPVSGEESRPQGARSPGWLDPRPDVCPERADAGTFSVKRASAEGIGVKEDGTDTCGIERIGYRRDMEGTEKRMMEETLLQLATKLREKAFYRYVMDRPAYQELLQAACEAEKGYYDMGLTKEQREQIDRLLEGREEAGEYELTLTYVAGLLDGVAALRELGFLDMFVTTGKTKEAGDGRS